MNLGTEFKEGFKLSFAALMANKVRSVLTMLGIIIGIVSVTLMGAAIAGLADAFNRSVEVIGADVLYLQKWPWFVSDEWWKLRNRKNLRAEYADRIKRDAALLAAVAPVEGRTGIVRYENKTVNNVSVEGTTSDLEYVTDMTFSEGRFFTDQESRGGRPVAVLGSDVGGNCFPIKVRMEK